MGKKTKIVESDPILKKNFKLQKRKRQKQQQKLKLKQHKQQQQQKTRQLRKIQKKVQDDIQKLYQQQKAKIIMASKSKQISKKQQLLRAFQTNHSAQSSLKQRLVLKRKQQQFSKNLQKYQLNQINQQFQTIRFQNHFNPILPKFINDHMSKARVQTATKQMEDEIKKEITKMFSVRKIQDQQDLRKETVERINEQKHQIKQIDIQSNQPYIISKAIKQQRQILLSNRICSISNTFQTNNCSLVTKTLIPSQSLTLQPLSGYLNSLISSYIDVIHIQNCQQQTIQSFRQVVINHMFQHQFECFQALKNGKKAKGFTNAKSLVLTPYVGDARAIFDLIQHRFIPQNQKGQWKIQNKDKIQVEGDDENDFFRVGIKFFIKKKKIVYFANFDTSDIIVASPLGLKSIISGSPDKKKQNSFLSSIQILYIDRASVIMMQNWDHLIDVLANLNYMPKYESLKNSINDIRTEYLELKGRIYRQNIVFSEFSFPQLNSIKLNYFHNWQGCVTNKHIFKPLDLEVNNQIEKNFFKIQLAEPRLDLDTRFEYFKRKFWDKLHNTQHMKKVVLFVNSYFQYIRLKSFLQKVNASFESICQHTKKQSIQSRMSRFNNNQYRILLLTQRSFYFGLCQIKKFHHIYFYSLPKNAFIYKDLMEGITKDDEESKVLAVYSKYDKYIVERIVGTVKANQMVKEYCTNVSFIV